MNASDIVKAKQAQTLYKAYYKPTVFQSTVYNNITTVSSILDYVSSSQEITSDSYASCTTTVYNYSADPLFISYEMATQVKDGKYSCEGKVPSKMAWKNINSTIIYAYSTIYSTFSTPNIPIPSSMYITSTTVMTGVTPVIVPLASFYQRTNFDNSCNVCNNILGGPGACCHNCTSNASNP